MNKAKKLITILSGGASAFSPSDVAGLIAWYDFSDITTLWQTASLGTQITADGQKMLSVTDKSGTENHLLQGGSGIGFDYKVNIQNGLAAADSSAEFMKATVAALDQPYTLFLALRNKATAPNRYIHDGLTNTTALIYYTAASDLAMYAGTTLGATHELGVSNLITATFNSTSSSFIVNGNTPETGNAGVSDANGITLGGRADGGLLCDVYFCEYLAYTGALSAANKTLIQTYLNDKWALY